MSRKPIWTALAKDGQSKADTLHILREEDPSSSWRGLCGKTYPVRWGEAIEEDLKDGVECCKTCRKAWEAAQRVCRHCKHFGVAYKDIPVCLGKPKILMVDTEIRELAVVRADPKARESCWEGETDE